MGKNQGYVINKNFSIFYKHQHNYPIHVHREVGIAVKLVHKNATKPKKVHLPKKNFTLNALPLEIWQKPPGPSPWIFKPCASMN